MSIVTGIRLAIRRKIINDMVAATENAEVSEDPFPHFTIGQLFPRDVYEEMITRRPPEDRYQGSMYDRHHVVGGEITRKSFGLTDSMLSSLDEDTQAFWRTIRSALGSRGFKHAVFRKLAAGLARRLNCGENEAIRTPAYPLPESLRETARYHIKPHPDTRRKIVTMQICVAPDDTTHDLGTEFYRLSINPLKWSPGLRGFVIAKRMPFTPNSAYAFVVLNSLTLRSWHGRTTLPDGCGVRHSLLNIWYLKPEHGNQEVTRDIDAIEREQTHL